VISADIYGVSPHVGRGGWSWYTGSASWMYRAAIESILGLKIEHDKLSIRPCIPKEWDKFEMSYRKGKSLYKITVLNNQTVASMELNGTLIDGENIPLIDDGQEHIILMKLI